MPRGNCILGLTVFFILASCSEGELNRLRFGYEEPDFMGLAREAHERGSNSDALVLINRYFKAEVPNYSAFILRFQINLSLRNFAEAEEDLFLASNQSLRDYFSAGEGRSLVNYAFCIALLGDQEHAIEILKLLEVRHPEEMKSLGSDLAKVVREWFNMGLKLGNFSRETEVEE